METRAAGGAEVAAPGRDQLTHGVGTGGGHEAAPQGVVGGVEGDGEADLQVLAGKPVDGARDSTVETVMARWASRRRAGPSAGGPHGGSRRSSRGVRPCP